VERHLLPDEIDQLLDGEVGFETAPLKAHVRGCERCRAELDAARLVVRDLEHLPHLAPSPDFSAKVMSRVQVFVPWHVTLVDTVRGLIPRSRGWRMLAAAGLGMGALSVTAITIWALTRLDAVLFVAEMIWDRLRSGAMAALSGAVGALLGDPVATAFRASGGAGVAALFALLALTALITLGTLRVVTARSRAR
jgi:hypothetical protein